MGAACPEDRLLRRALANDRLDGLGVDRAEVRGVDSDVYHSPVLGPTVVDVAVQQPVTFVDGSVLDVPVAVLTVAAIREMAHHDSAATDVEAR